jgi:hypothetical protein
MNSIGPCCEEPLVEAGLATIEADTLRTRDAQLLALVAAGDHDRALGALYDAYAGEIYRLGLRLLSDRGQAEELVQRRSCASGAAPGATTRSARACAASPS